MVKNLWSHYIMLDHKCSVEFRQLVTNNMRLLRIDKYLTYFVLKIVKLCQNNTSCNKL